MKTRVAEIAAILFGVLAVAGVAPVPVIGRPKVQMLLVGAAVLCGMAARIDRTFGRMTRALDEIEERAEKTELGVSELGQMVHARLVGEETGGLALPLPAIPAELSPGRRMLSGVQEGQVVNLDAVRQAIRRSGALS